MVIDSYPGNSYREKEPERTPRVKKVIQGTAKEGSKTLSQKIKEAFTVEDSESIGMFILYDLIVPNIKSLILDIVGQGLERKFYGTSSRVSGRNKSYTSYSKVSSGASNVAYQNYKNREETKPRNSGSVNDIILETRGDAEVVLDTLLTTLDQYDIVTVSDLKDCIGITASFTDEKYGWNDLRSARILNVRGGYLLDLPPAQPID